MDETNSNKSEKWKSQEAEMQDTSVVIQAWMVKILVFFQPTGYATESPL